MSVLKKVTAIGLYFYIMQKKKKTQEIILYKIIKHCC